MVQKGGNMPSFEKNQQNLTLTTDTECAIKKKLGLKYSLSKTHRGRHLYSFAHMYNTFIPYRSNKRKMALQ